MKVHVLQHVPSEGLGSIEAWLEQRGATVTFTYFFASSALPSVHELDLVVALGGPMSVNDEDDGNELVDAPYIQTAQQILGASASAYAGINALMMDVLEYLTAD